jgi:hypothetical protein
MIALAMGAALAIRHAFSKPVRMLLIVFAGAALAQALLLPVTGKRYSYHLATFWILLASAGIVALCRELARVRAAELRGYLAAYGQTVAAAFAIGFVVLGHGLLFDLSEMSGWRVSGESQNALMFPGQRSTALYVKEHMQPGDVVIVNAPHVIDHYLGRPSDYWLQTQLHLQAVIDDENTLPLHRYKGTPMLRDVDHLFDVFSRHERVWFITEPSFNARTNVDAAMRSVEGSMDVVYEDFDSVVYFSGDAHRIAAMQRRNARTLQQAAPLLPAPVGEP